MSRTQPPRRISRDGNDPHRPIRELGHAARVQGFAAVRAVAADEAEAAALRGPGQAADFLAVVLAVVGDCSPLVLRSFSDPDIATPPVVEDPRDLSPSWCRYQRGGEGRAKKLFEGDARWRC